ncbi:hypothetical protein GA0061105_12247 [Rhizobium aethiopicum]|uniref:Uncharacterized protein n=1 Tax=Rhizobium aethiopicum TaxID=1138170 RepID=A0A1C3YBJ7_9HYPH|nr:hypothetical protein GA0061105_12247 [Rhizobium aethiopicum]
MAKFRVSTPFSTFGVFQIAGERKGPAVLRGDGVGVFVIALAVSVLPLEISVDGYQASAREQSIGGYIFARSVDR